MKHFIFTFLVSLIGLFGFIPLAYSGQEGIAVIVNDNIITHSDINDRLKLIMQSSGIPNTAELRKRMTPQIKGMLIEEQLKIQEANELGIDITQEQIDAGFNRIASQNNIPSDKFMTMMKRSGINLDTLYDQIRSELAWGGVVAQNVRPRVDVTEADIDAELAQLEKNLGKAQYLISEIFLGVESPAQDSAVSEAAQNLYQQLQKQPNAFPKIAQQFSQSAGAAQGGDMGWVAIEQSEDAIESALSTMPKGALSAPIRGKSGYHILLMRDQRSLDKASIPNRDAVLSKLGNERLGRRAKSYLLDLKANAFIEDRG